MWATTTSVNSNGQANGGAPGILKFPPVGLLPPMEISIVDEENGPPHFQIPTMMRMTAAIFVTHTVKSDLTGADVAGRIPSDILSMVAITASVPEYVNMESKLRLLMRTRGLEPLRSDQHSRIYFPDGQRP